MKQKYVTPINRLVQIPAEDLMIPSLIGPSGRENHPLDPSSIPSSIQYI